MKKHWSSRALAALMLVFSGACGDSTGLETIAGLYILQSIDGNPLPHGVIDEEMLALEYTASHIQINDNRTCSSSFTFTTEVNGQTVTDSESETCTWSQNGSTIVFTWEEGDTDTGSIDGDVLTIPTAIGIFVFER